MEPGTRKLKQCNLRLLVSGEFVVGLGGLELDRKQSRKLFMIIYYKKQTLWYNYEATSSLHIFDTNITHDFRTSMPVKLISRNLSLQIMTKK